MKYWFDITLAIILGALAYHFGRKIVKLSPKDQFERLLEEDREYAKEMLKLLLVKFAPVQWEGIPKTTIALEETDLLYLLNQEYKASCTT